MKFTVKRTSDWLYKKEIELNTLDELIEWMVNEKCEIIMNALDPNISGAENYLNPHLIEIYDDYRGVI